MSKTIIIPDGSAFIFTDELKAIDYYSSRSCEACNNSMPGEHKWFVFDLNGFIVACDISISKLLKENSNDEVCICRGCPNKATETENSPYMNDYCDPCTYERHDLPSEYGDPHA